MTDFIINNPISLRSCIHYEFLKGKKPFGTYKSMMKMFGDEFMDYPEFEFWYMRFARGNFDLDYDISLEPKKRQITDLPVDLFENIGNFLHFKDRINLRIVSKDIQLLVDKWNPNVTDFAYHSFNWWSIKQNSKTHSFKNWKRLDQLPVVMKILKNPKLRLERLSVSQDEKWEIIEEELRKSSTKLHVIYLSTNYPIDFRLFSLESLEEVHLHINEKSVKKMNDIVRSKLCKELKMLTIKTDLSPSNFPFGSFIGYPRFTIRIHPNRSEVKILEFIKKLMKCTQLELCKLEFRDYTFCPTWESVKEYLSEDDNLVPNFPDIRRYPIQGSSDFYEIHIEKTLISIERKS